MTSQDQQKKYQKKILGNNKKFTDTNQSQGRNGGGKTWANHSNKKGCVNKDQKKQKSDNNANVDTKSKNGVHLVEAEWMFLCNKGCGFITSHTTGLHDTWDACMKNNQPFTFTDTHAFQQKW